MTNKAETVKKLLQKQVKELEEKIKDLEELEKPTQEPVESLFIGGYLDGKRITMCPTNFYTDQYGVRYYLVKYPFTTFGYPEQSRVFFFYVEEAFYNSRHRKHNDMFFQIQRILFDGYRLKDVVKG